MTKELKVFKEHFEASTGIRVMEVIEDRQCPHWKRLLFPGINAVEMLKIAEYIMMNFSEPGRYSHLLPKFYSYNDCIALTVDVREIQKFIMKKSVV